MDLDTHKRNIEGYFGSATKQQQFFYVLKKRGRTPISEIELKYPVDLFSFHLSRSIVNPDGNNDKYSFPLPYAPIVDLFLVIKPEDMKEVVSVVVDGNNQEYGRANAVVFEDAPVFSFREIDDSTSYEAFANHIVYKIPFILIGHGNVYDASCMTSVQHLCNVRFGKDARPLIGHDVFIMAKILRKENVKMWVEPPIRFIPHLFTTTRVENIDVNTPRRSINCETHGFLVGVMFTSVNDFREVKYFLSGDEYFGPFSKRYLLQSPKKYVFTKENHYFLSFTGTNPYSEGETIDSFLEEKNLVHQGAVKQPRFEISFTANVVPDKMNIVFYFIGIAMRNKELLELHIQNNKVYHYYQK